MGFGDWVAEALASRTNLNYMALLSLLAMLLIIGSACVSTTSPPPRNLVEATRIAAEIAGAPKERSADPTSMASTTSPPPRNLVEATRIVPALAGVPEEESADPTIIASATASPPRNSVEATRIIPVLAEVPREESVNPTIIASPPQNLVEATRVLALIEGILAEEDGCLRITESGTGGDAIVWQKDVFSIERRGDAVLIVDLFGTNGQPSPTVIWRLGDMIRAAGGTTGLQGADDHAGAGFSERCAGPYSLVSMVR